MSQTHRKDSVSKRDRVLLDPSSILKNTKTIQRLRSAGVLTPSEAGEGRLWEALMRSPFGKSIGLAGRRVVWIPFGLGTKVPISVYLLDGRKHDNIGYRLGNFVAVNQRQLAEVVTSWKLPEASSNEELTCISQLGDVAEIDMSPLEEAEFDFVHCPRIWNEASQTREFDEKEYFSRLDRLNVQRRACGKGACAEGITPSTYGI